MKKVFIILLTMLLSVVTAEAKVNNDSVKVYFDFGAIFLHTDYMGNQQALDDAIGKINQQRQQGMTVSRVVITSSASPEGTTEVNRQVAASRAKSLADYLAPQIGFDASKMEVVNRCIDWNELQRLAQNDKRISSNHRLIRYINKVISNRAAGDSASDATIKANMQNISEADYHYMRRHLFPKMRYAKAHVEMAQANVAPAETTISGRMAQGGMPGTASAYQRPDSTRLYPDSVKVLPDGSVVYERTVAVNEYYVYPDGTKVPVSQYEAYQDSIRRAAQQTEQAAPKVWKHNYYWAAKTNLLFDAVLIPNVSLEWAFAPRWSVSAEYMHAWWKSDRSHKYWRTYGGNLELRYWFGKKAAQKRLTGHHVGLYAGALTYDFEWGGKGYLAKDWSTNFGVSYGYSAPIARRLNLDFNIGIGYFSGKYDEYHPQGDYYFWDSTKNRKFFGPTRAEVTLVWLLGHGNVNK